MQLSEKLTKEIYEKYPLFWNNFEKHIYLKYTKYNFYFDNSTSTIKISIGYSGFWKYEIVPFSMLYGLLVDFFDDNEIYITINKLRGGFNFDLVDKNNTALYELFPFFKTRPEAQYQAILKACEIKENADEKQ